jgi:cytoskeletal protein CcmA (bactofilin family)
MFGKEKTKNEPAIVPIHKTPAKEISTLIGEGCKVETRIDGIIKGDLTGEVGLIIGSKGLVEGDVCAAEVVVYGNVVGNIEADRLELKRGSNINGNLSVNNLVTENGALFNGSCAMKSTDKNISEISSEASVQ